MVPRSTLARDSIKEHVFLAINKEVLMSFNFLVRERLLSNSPNAIISLQGTVIDWEEVLKYLVDLENFIDLLNLLG